MQDDRINLIEPAAIRPEDTAQFRSDPGAVLQFIQYRMAPAAVRAENGRIPMKRAASILYKSGEKTVQL